MSNTELIYLDNNATTRVDPLVVQDMLPFFTEVYGNASSRNHPYGWKADQAVKKARFSVAELLNAEEKEITFTSGATEAINLVIKGAYEAYSSKGNHIITSKTEHKAVLDVCEYLESKGAKVTYLDVNPYGLIDIEQLKKSMTEKTILVSIMWVNNETGVVQPMRQIGRLCKEHDVLFMSDATQAAGKMDLNPRETGVDLLTLSAHKMYGPKGVGALYVGRKDPKINIVQQIHGGGHERATRSGTLNVPGIVGLGSACQLAISDKNKDMMRVSTLRHKLEKALLQIEETHLNGHVDLRLGNVCNITFRYIESEALIATFNQSLAVSSGSACTSATLEPSHVLQAMGLSDHDAHGAIRFSIGKYNTEEDIDLTIRLVKEGVEQLRCESPIWKMYKEGVDVGDLL